MSRKGFDPLWIAVIVIMGLSLKQIYHANKAKEALGTRGGQRGADDMSDL